MRKIIEVQKPDVGTDYYVDSNGVFMASFTKDTPDDGVAEILGLPRNVPLATALAQAGISIATDQEPPPGGPWKWVNGAWEEIPKTYTQKRREEYQAELGALPDQIDAIYKGLMILLPDLIASKTLSPETIAALTPDKDADANTPAGWLGKVQDIKARNPKP